MALQQEQKKKEKDNTSNKNNNRANTSVLQDHNRSSFLSLLFVLMHTDDASEPVCPTIPENEHNSIRILLD